MTKIRKYNEIENAHNLTKVAAIRESGYEGKWCLTEKIHGTNFSIRINLNDMSVFFCNRTAVVGDNFYNHLHVVNENIKPDYDRLVKNLKEIYGDSLDEYHQVAVFGELFGGFYPHPEVQACPRAKKVQKGIWYTPDNEFMAFDIGLLRPWRDEEKASVEEKVKLLEQRLEEAETPERAKSLRSNISGLRNSFDAPMLDYVGWNEFLKILEGTNIKSVPCLGLYDTLDEALGINPTFESIVYAFYGLPKIENNFAEGIVIKAVEGCTAYGGRLILKNKNPKFDEIKTGGSGEGKKKAEPIPLSEEGQKVFDELSAYVNRNRLDSVVSKLIPPIEMDRFGEILRLLNEDIREDYLKDHDISNVEINEMQQIYREIGKLAAAVVKEYFMDDAR